MSLNTEAEDFILPWELIYPTPLITPINASLFWGMQYIISRTLIQDIRPGDELSPIIQTARPRIGLIVDHGLNYVVSHEIPIFQQLQQAQQIELKILDALSDEQYDTSIQLFSQFLNEDIQIFHGACHILVDAKTSGSYLLISDEFPITYEDFITYKLHIGHSPLVVLNACLSGTRSPLFTSNWASMLWARGARGVLATEFHVPDWFAAAFIKIVYQHLLSGVPIGQSLLAARQHFLQTYNNLSGLGYSLYASPSIQIVTEQQAINEKEASNG